MAVHPLDHARVRGRPASTRARRVVASAGHLLVGAAARARASSRIVRARAGYAAGVAVASWGMGVQFGLGWALMAGGVACSVSFLLLYPVDDQ